MEGYDDATYGDRFADVYDEWFTEIGDLDACVECLATLATSAHGGRSRATPRPLVVELGVGTGRIAVPLAERDLDVRGIDSSTAMIDALRLKPGAEQIATSVIDMAEAMIPPQPDDPAGVAADLVFVAYNTLFNLPDVAAQRRCIQRVSQLLSATGRFVVEAFVPDITPSTGNRVTVRSIEADRLVLVASVLDEEQQTIQGQYVDISEQGIRLRPWHVSYLMPEQLDEIADEAGLELEHRWADYTREPFDSATSAHHVSVYRTSELGRHARRFRRVGRPSSPAGG
ncbi:MAG: class I SAM-dependent methyltransferase [Actinobacteria bacterium]|nr:class I SAM-dependent methyltransferase [Actinomycetota bacterium]